MMSSLRLYQLLFRFGVVTMIVTFPVVPADIILTEFIDELFVLLATVTVSVYTNMG